MRHAEWLEAERDRVSVELTSGDVGVREEARLWKGGVPSVL
jgi:hypothetical protein